MKRWNELRHQFKKKLKTRQRIFAAWTSLAHTSISEIFAKTGVDFIGMDIEHSTISLEQSRLIIAACQANSTLCLPRIASHNMEAIKRLLDSGADGLMVPTVSSHEEVEKLISWCKYPPRGKRGFGVARGQGYGFDFDEYVSKWNEVSSLIIQIENIEGVNNIERLLRYEDVDGVMVGPYDISGSLGIPGQLEHPKVKEVSKRVIDSCARHGKSCGIHIVDPDVENVKEKFDMGFTFVVLSSDVFLLWKWAERAKGIIGEI